jgi:hypothetical protein
MAKIVNLPTGVQNPFTEDFLEWWNKWKDYKFDAHGFKYKGVMSEQVKLMQLHGISGGDEEIAKEIILRSIGEQWSGLFPLPPNYIKNIENGNTAHQQPSNSSTKLGTSDKRTNKASNW